MSSPDQPGVAPGGRLGSYRLLAEVGRGGMGQIFRARDEKLGRDVAVKVLRNDRVGLQARARFDREVEAASRVHHPNLVRVHASGEERGVPYLVMELVEGQGLDEHLRRTGRLSPLEVASLGCKLARALEALHAAGVLHRDVKPSNILLDAEGEPRLADFGMARLDDSPQLSVSRQLLGTPTYAAPEQFGGTMDARADLYALGATLYELAAGQPPHEATTVFALLQAKLVPPPPPSPPGSHGGPELDRVCLRCLASEPRDRFPDAGALAAALEGVLATPPPPTKWKKPALAALVLGLFALAVGIAASAGKGPVEPRPHGTATASPDASPVATTTTNASPSPKVPDLGLALAALASATAAGAAPPVDLLLAASEAALPNPARVSLVGEAKGIALGDALLDARDAVLDSSRPVLSRADLTRAEALLAHARALARAKLARAPSDPGGRALRAYVQLAEASAPRRPLGTGTLGTAAVTTGTVLADLKVARGMAGAPGARAAWLLVDLLVCAPRPEEARLALDDARTRAPNEPARASLERVLDTLPSAKGFAALAARVEDPKTREAGAVELSRFFARLGSPNAVEHPEVVRGPAEVERILAREPPSPVHLELAPRAKTAPILARLGDVNSRLRTAPRPVVLASRDAVAAIQSEALAADATDPAVLSACADVRFDTLAPAVYLLFACQGSYHHARRLDALFHGRECWEAREAGNWDAPAPVWMDDALDACSRFDARLLHDLAEDPLVARLRKSGVSDLEVERAARAASGLRRIEVVRDVGRFDATTRARLVFEALVLSEDAVRIVGPPALVQRAHLRPLALPEPLGSALALLDVRRLERFYRAAAQVPALPEGWELDELAFRGACAASWVPGDSRPAEDGLLRFGVHVAREAAIAGGADRAEAALERLARDRLRGLRLEDGGLGTRIRVDPVREGVRASVAELDALAGPFPEDRARAGRTYVYRPPPPGDMPAFVPELPTWRTLKAEGEAEHDFGRADGDGWSANPERDASPSTVLCRFTPAAVPAGLHEARFWLSGEHGVGAEEPVALVDVVDATSRATLGARCVWRHELDLGGKPGAFTVPFASEAGHALQLRVHWVGTAYVRATTVEVTAALPEDPIPPAAPAAAASPSPTEPEVVWVVATDLKHNIGHVEADGSWAAVAGIDSAGVLSHGPPTRVIPAGHHEARFVLRVDALPNRDVEVAVLDVGDTSQKPEKRLAVKNLRRHDFVAGTDAEFTLPFVCEENKPLTFRVVWRGLVSLKVRSVSISYAPPTHAVDDAEIAWVSMPGQLHPGEKASFRVLLRNTGLVPWGPGREVRLAAVGESKGDAARFLPGPSLAVWLPPDVVVPPGESWEFVIDAVAPKVGRYDVAFHLLRVGLGHPFGPSVVRTIVVSNR